MDNTITISKKEKGKLEQAALRYGFSVDELTRRILAEATRSLLAIPEESLDEYEHPEKIKKAFSDALRADRQGKILRSLPKSLRRQP